MLTDRPLIGASGDGKEQIIYRRTHIDSLRRHLYATGQYIYFLTHLLYLVSGAILTAFTNVSVEPAHLFPIACEDAIAYRVFKSEKDSKGESEGKTDLRISVLQRSGIYPGTPYIPWVYLLR
jgi:hypothetical protein